MIPVHKAAITCVVEILLEQNEERAVERGRYMSLEASARRAMILPSTFRSSPADRSGRTAANGRSLVFSDTTQRDTQESLEQPAYLPLSA